MPSQAPIGVFDSGIGGLTVAKAVVSRLPHESLHYIGDTAHIPYGDKSPERLKEYASRIATRLCDSGCKALVIACNSASSNALAEVKAVAGDAIPVIDVVLPVVDHAATHHAGGDLALIGTRATVQSGLYDRLLKDKGMNVTSLPTPLLASAIEEGFHNGTISQAVVEAYFSSGWVQDKDALILACTHYPLVMEDIQRQIPDGMAILDAPSIVAARLEAILSRLELKSDALEPTHRFEVSDWTQSFADGATHIMGRAIELHEIDLSSRLDQVHG